MIKVFIDKLHTTYFDQWRSSASPEVREAIHAKILVLKEIEHELRLVVRKEQIVTPVGEKYDGGEYDGPFKYF